jgi:uncharacterized protein (TIGR03437 family)
MIYAYPDQLSAITPFKLAGGAIVDGVFYHYIEVESNGNLSNIVAMPRQRPTPGLFSLDGTGSGQGAVLNQDFTVNGPSNPARRGSAVMLFGTGFGQTVPPLTDGEIVPLTSPFPSAGGLTVSIGGVSAPSLYLGAAPGLVAGVYQINAAVPANIAPGNAVPVHVTFADQSNTITIAVE